MKYKKQLQQESKSIQLEKDEKEQIRESISRLMELQPVRIATATRQRKQARTKTGGFLFLSQRHMFAKIAIAIVLACTGATSAAAEASLPGDLLYPVKVSINEEVRGAFTFGSEAKADWEVRKAERRAEEVAALKAEGRLTASQESKAADAIETHLDAAASHIEDSREEDADTPTTQLDTRIEVLLDRSASILGEAAVRLNTPTSSMDDNDEEKEMKTESREPTSDNDRPVVDVSADAVQKVQAPGAQGSATTGLELSL